MRKTSAVINLKNLKHNYLGLRRKAKNSKVMAVVKADAYGHGMLQCVKALSELGEKQPEYFGVALLEEAIELRKSGLTKNPILSFAPFHKSELQDYLLYDIIPTVAAVENLKDLTKYHGNKKLKVHVNVDTGMGRLGIKYSDVAEFITKLSRNPSIKIDGIYTHFATSDERDKSYAKLQLGRFKDVLETLKAAQINYGIAHTANSGAILDIPDSIFDMIRPGISLYGYYPSLETTESVKLKPVMSLFTEVSTIKEINKGESVSYGRLFFADKKTNVATAPIGYADGVVRNLTNKMKGIIKNKVYSQVGRVTMDRIMFDVGGSNVKPGDRIILLGKSKDHEITAWDWCKELDTIPYEITCNISKRVPREYIR